MKVKISLVKNIWKNISLMKINNSGSFPVNYFCITARGPKLAQHKLNQKEA